MSTFKTIAPLAVFAALALTGCASTTTGLDVKEVGSYHVGGRAASLTGLPEKDVVLSAGAPPLKVNPNGDFQVEQMYTRYTRLNNPRGQVPLLMWHGGGLAGTTYETKPDGAAGWEMFFLKAGWDVYVSDAVERGRASWARYPEVFTSEPIFRTKKEAWELFRIGTSYHLDPKQRLTNAGTQFPVQAFDQFAKQSIPRWASNDGITQLAYNQYVEKACPCVIVVHSQGGNFAINAALKYPDKVKALVVVEPSGSPDPDKTDLSPLKNVPTLWVWGDDLASSAFWRNVYAKQEVFRQAAIRQGAISDKIDLPAQGISGNSHMLMMDRNSDQIAGLIQNWLVQRGLVNR